MLPTNHLHGSPRKPDDKRRYSLFSNTSSATNELISRVSLSKIFPSNNGRTTTTTVVDNNGNYQSDERTLDEPNKNLFRRNTCDMEAFNSANVCQRCKRFEVDLTNTFDNLSATDAELKASRQVISLLQRQLELFQVEKDGLEKLIIAQSESSLPSISTSSKSGNVRENNDALLVDESADDGPSLIDVSSTTDPDDIQKKLLRLIRTQLYAKDEEIVKLKSSLKEAQNEKEQLNLQLHMLEEDVTKYKSENSLLRENLALRDQTIVSLSNEVFEQGGGEYKRNQRRQSSADSLMSSDSRINAIKTQRHIDKLIDTLDAYKKTNELLSNNVIKLTERCTQAEKKEIETRSECQELEAKCCQIQSKLLSLLKEIEQSQETSGDHPNREGQEFICSESVKLLIKRLLEDKSLDIPLSWKEGNKVRRNNKSDKIRQSNQECDELGFYIPNDQVTLEYESGETVTPETTSPRLQTPKRQQHVSQLDPVEEDVEGASEPQTSESSGDRNHVGKNQHSIDATKSDETAWRFRWDEFIKDFDKVDLERSKDFKTLLRSGVPQEYRCKVWKALVDMKVGTMRQQHGPDYYQSLLEPNQPHQAANLAKNTLNPSSKQIELDLLRTLPNNRYFETIDSPGTVRLRRVLIAYSGHNPKVGYCQGMNRLAAVALLVLPEEEAFWCLVAIVDRIMPVGYYNDLWLAQVDSNVVMDYVAQKMPALSDHFKMHGIELSLFAWFLTIFVDGTPPALFLRLWDCFLYEGDKIMFRVALALLKMYERQLIRLNSSVAVNSFLRSAVNAPMNIDQFFEVAFDWINPLPSRALRNKRQQNFKIIKSGFIEAEAANTTASKEVTNYRRVQDVDDDVGGSHDRDEDTPNEDSSIISI